MVDLKKEYFDKGIGAVWGKSWDDLPKSASARVL
jgi:hypothetical protein